MEEEAARLAILLKAGLKSRQDVIRWADDQIALAPKPSFEMIGLSTIGDAHIQNIFSILRNLSSSIGHFEALTFSLPDFYSAVLSKQLKPVDAAFFIHHYCDENFSSIPDNYWPLWSFAEDYSLARDGVYGSEAELDPLFIEVLKKQIEIEPAC